jgi:heme exporter protein CcmD
MGFVIGSYALSAILILGLTAYVLARDRRMRAEADRLERSRRKGDA